MKLNMLFSIESKHNPHYFYPQAQWALGKDSFSEGGLFTQNMRLEN